MTTNSDPMLLVVGCSGSSARAEGKLVDLGIADGPDGLLAFAIDRNSGRLERSGQMTAWLPTSYAAYMAKDRRLFAVSQTVDNAPARIASFSFEKGGEFRLLSEQSAEGVEACHLTADPSGRYVISAHFRSASYAVHPVESDGQLKPASHVYRVIGSGPHPRQDEPHPHMVQVSPDRKWIVTADMGTDEVASLTLDRGKGRLIPHQLPAARVQSGGGARHFVFHSSGRVFACNELDSTVTSFSFDARQGNLLYVRHDTTLLDLAREGDAQCGAIRLSPDERFLYVANRKRQTIAAYRVDPDQLRPLAEFDCPGAGARDMFVVENAIYVAFAGAGQVGVFSRNPETGAMGATVQTIILPVPMSVLAIPADDRTSL